MILIDIIFFIENKLLLYISTQSILFFYNYFLPYFDLMKITFLIILILSLFIIEVNHCVYLLNKYPFFPFHCLIEIVGIFLFDLICKNIITL